MYARQPSSVSGKFVASSAATIASATKAMAKLYAALPQSSKDIVNINTERSLGDVKINIQVTDVSGAVVINKIVESPGKTNVLHQLNISHLPAGTH